MSNTLIRSSSAIALLPLLVLLFALPVAAQKIEAEELVTKHLEAVGAKDKRSLIKNRLVVGASTFESKLPNRQTGGKALIVTEGADIFFVTSFNSQEYPYEKIGFFGDKPSLPHVTAGTRSPLGAFIADHPKILSEGLFLGSMSNSWALLDIMDRKPKIGKPAFKKLNEREVYVVDYFPKGLAAEFTVKLFFDAETFNHVRTEYRHTISPRELRAGILGVQSGVNLSMIENFGDFKTVDGITLPYRYAINYRTESNSGTFEFNWGVDVSQYHFNQSLDPGFFTFDEKK